MTRHSDIMHDLGDFLCKAQDTFDELDWNIHEEIVDEIGNCPPTRKVDCCGQTIIVPIEDVYVECPNCGKNVKVRAFAAGVDIEDVLLAAKILFEERNKK